MISRGHPAFQERSSLLALIAIVVVPAGPCQPGGFPHAVQTHGREKMQIQRHAS